MKVAAIVVGQRFTCPTCQAESLERATYEIDGADLGDQDPLVYLVRRRVASDETRDVPIGALASQAGNSAPTITRRPSERTQRPSANPADPADQDADGSTDLGAPMSDSSKLGMGILAPSARLGSYKIVETLGQGGMGVVYKAHDTSLDRHVALKVLSRELTANKQFVERFVREARAAAQLTHPNITSIFFCGSEGRTHFYVMEFVEGRNLADLV
ncbi:MAG: protein kinase, partial [Planctomycetota bacterium]